MADGPTKDFRLNSILSGKLELWARLAIALSWISGLGISSRLERRALFSFSMVVSRSLFLRFGRFIFGKPFGRFGVPVCVIGLLGEAGPLLGNFSFATELLAAVGVTDVTVDFGLHRMITSSVLTDRREFPALRWPAVSEFSDDTASVVPGGGFVEVAGKDDFGVEGAGDCRGGEYFSVQDDGPAFARVAEGAFFELLPDFGSETNADVVVVSRVGTGRPRDVDVGTGEENFLSDEVGFVRSDGREFFGFVFGCVEDGADLEFVKRLFSVRMVGDAVGVGEVIVRLFAPSRFVGADYSDEGEQGQPQRDYVDQDTLCLLLVVKGFE